MGRAAGALCALVLVGAMAPAHASANGAHARGGGSRSSAFCDAGSAVKDLYDDEAGIDMKKPRSVRKVQRVVAGLQEAAPSELQPSFRRLMHFYDLVVAGDIQLLGNADRYFAASKPASRGAYRIAQALQRRCGIHFRG